ncbi:Ig heavy chain V region 1B43 [Myotis davidii]|uniref:Ig heavy chain V region 1B43 n=1 Tax=Myotis davidii TaxID=225400 RepID=L5M770_MYODS|nr:Ig heavy chain V region 1B43 [Myotis davidii]
MRLLRLLLCLVTAPQGVLSQVKLQDSGSSMMKPLQTLYITSTVSRGSVTSSYYQSWIGQHPGKGSQWMGY